MGPELVWTRGAAPVLRRDLESSPLSPRTVFLSCQHRTKTEAQAPHRHREGPQSWLREALPERRGGARIIF